MCFEAMVDGCLNALTEEIRGSGKKGIEARTARLLPGLLLARVDGKSPVEYLTQETDKDLVRHAATGLLLEPVARLSDVRRVWEDELSTRPKP